MYIVLLILFFIVITIIIYYNKIFTASAERPKNKMRQIEETGLKTFIRALRRFKGYKFIFCNCIYPELKKYGKFYTGAMQDIIDKTIKKKYIVFDENLMPVNNQPKFINILAEETKALAPTNISDSNTIYVDNIEPVYEALKRNYKNVEYAPDNFNMAQAGDIYWRLLA